MQDENPTQPAASAPQTQAVPQIDVAALENELRSASPDQEEAPFSDKVSALQNTRASIEQKIIDLKDDVKAKLTELKNLRATLEEEIKKIKELEATEQKIDAELAKIKELEDRHAEIENEIKEIEALTKLAA